MASGTLLFARQSEALKGRAVSDFFNGLDVLHLSRPGIPDLDELNERLFARTGWTIVSVPGLVPDDIFFEHLSKRRFPAGNFIRSADSLDYIEQPDVFHDVFGHVPMLAQPAVADFMQAMGAEGLAALEPARCTGWRGSTGTASNSASRRRMARPASTAPACSRASARAISRWRAPSRAGAPSTSRRCCAPATARTPSSSGYFVIPSFAALLRLLTDADLARSMTELDEAPARIWTLPGRTGPSGKSSCTMSTSRTRRFWRAMSTRRRSVSRRSCGPLDVADDEVAAARRLVRGGDADRADPGDLVDDA